MWVELSLGYGSTNQDIMGMLVQAVFLNKNVSFSANYLDFDQVGSFINISSSTTSDYPQGKIFGAQGGLSTDYKKIRIGCSTGLSYAMFYKKYYPTNGTVGYKWFNTLGLPVSLDLDWLLLERFGLKTSIYYNYNVEQPFIMANLGFMLGKLK